MLPPRRNRGVPPRRYSSEHQPRASRYPVANLVRGSMTNEAKAFMTALYTEEILRNVLQAKSNREWKEAMEAEMEALAKNGTWEVYELPSGKRLVVTPQIPIK